METDTSRPHLRFLAGPGIAVLARRATCVLLALAVIRLWLSPLGSSFWIDETGTFWTVKDGLREMLTRVHVFPSITPAYGFIAWAAYALGGAREYALRLPSVIGISLASLFVYRLAKRLLDDASAFPAVAAFVCAESVAFAASDARPYALLLMAVAGSTLALVRWLQTGALRHAALCVIAAAVVPYLQYLALPVLGAHALYALMRLREGAPVRPRHLMAAAGCVAVLILPLAPGVLDLLHNRGAHSFASRPNVADVAALLVSPVLIFAAAMGILLAIVVCGRLRVSPLSVPHSTLVLLVTLALVPVFTLFTVSILNPTSLFVPRYMIELQVSLALLIGWGIGRIQPELARSVVVASVIVCSIAAFGKVGRIWAMHGRQDWRDAMAAIRQIAGNTPMPAVVQCGFTEASADRLESEGSSYLMAPLSLYRAPGPVIPLPYNAKDERTLLYLESNVVPAIEHSDRFALVTTELPPIYDSWMEGRLPGYAARPVGDFTDIRVTLFEARERRTGALGAPDAARRP